MNINDQNVTQPFIQKQLVKQYLNLNPSWENIIWSSERIIGSSLQGTNGSKIPFTPKVADFTKTISWSFRLVLSL